MIRINLLQERKAKRTDKGQRSFMVGVALVLLAGLSVYQFLHTGLAEELDEARATKQKLAASIKKLREETKDFDEINRRLEEVKARGEAIQRLNDARAVPAWLLRELSNILTKEHKPTMTREMEDRVKADPNRQWSQGWDPKHLWIESLEEKDGTFILKGGAQVDKDATELALRMQASAFFTNVAPEGGQTDVDSKSKVGFYRFTITGKVVY